jgi:hypothetical protein
MELKDILYKIKIEKNDDYYFELIKNKIVNGLIWSVVKRHRSNQDIVYSYAVSALYELTMNDYCYQEDYTEANYVAFINICLRRRVADMVQDDRLSNTCLYDESCKNKPYFDTQSEEDNFNELIKILNPTEINIIYKIYHDKYTEQEIADELDVSQQAINKIKQKSLEKLEKICKNGC